MRMSVTTTSGRSRSTASRSVSRSPQTATTSTSGTSSSMRCTPSRTSRLSSASATRTIARTTVEPPSPSAKPSTASADQSQLARAAYGLAALGDPELAGDALEVRLHGVDRDEELARNFLVRHQRRQVAEDDLLLVAERVEQLARQAPALRAATGERREQGGGEPAVRRPVANREPERLDDRGPGVEERPAHAFGLRELERTLDPAPRLVGPAEAVGRERSQHGRLDRRAPVAACHLPVDHGRERFLRTL